VIEARGAFRAVGRTTEVDFLRRQQTPVAQDDQIGKVLAAVSKRLIAMMFRSGLRVAPMLNIICVRITSFIDDMLVLGWTCIND
jgi:hypothetical protein